MNRRLSAELCIFVVSLAAPSARAMQARTWRFENTYRPGQGMSANCLEPCAGSGGLAWVGVSPLGTADLVFWDGLSAASLRPDYLPNVPYSTREEWSAAAPSLWGSSMAFCGTWGLGPQQIFHWHSDTVHRITYDQRSNINPSLHDGAIAWQSRTSDSDDWEILYWDGYGVRAITENSVDDTDPSLYERTIAWCSAGKIVYAEIPPGVYWESPPIPVVVGTGQEPSLHKDQIAYQTWDGHDQEIFAYDIRTGDTVQITDNDYYDGGPSLFDGSVAWEAYIDDDWEICYSDGRTVQRLTDSEFDDKDPSLWGTGLSTTIAYLGRSQSSVWLAGGYVIRARPAVNISVAIAHWQVVVTWPSLEGRAYRVEYSDDLVNWKVAAESVPSAGYGETSWTDGEGAGTTPPPSEVSQRFYRVCETE